MKMKLAVVASLAVVACMGMVAQVPQAEIKNAKLHAKVYLPDPKNGFYKGTRFDYSGVITDLEVAGHHLYQPWFTGRDATARDFNFAGDAINVGINSAMVGPVEEFQKPQGFDTAKAGETFVKIGVGVLRKGDDPVYQFGKHFDMVDAGTWTTRKTPSSVTFQQTLGTAQSPYAYVYTKTVRFVGNESKMVIEHSLKNVGTMALQTNVYDHNFLTIDGLPVGSDYSITVPYSVKSTRAPDVKYIKMEGNKAEYIADVTGENRVAWNMSGYSDSPKDYDFTIVNKKAQLAINITGDRPLANANIWSIRSVMAVEPFIAVSAEPGKEFTWSYTYTYTDLSK